MSKENKQPEFDLVSKYLAGEATPEEAMQLDDFFRKQGNKEEFYKLTKLWNKLSNSEVPKVPQIEEEWARLQKLTAPVKPKVRRLFIYRLIAAASVIGLLILSYVLFKSDDRRDITHNETQHIIKSDTAVRSYTLPDGSIITINKNSSLAYSAAFNTNARESVLDGEAYFDVVPNNAKPFVISVGELKIKVVGTSFNVRDISSSKRVEVQVRSGIVKMYTAQKEITVAKGQTGAYSKADGALVLQDTFDVNSTSYATKSFSFNDLPLVDACRYLENAFHVAIKVDGQKFSNCRLTAHFNGKSLEYILDIISATLNSSYKKQGNTIYIVGEGCN